MNKCLKIIFGVPIAKDFIHTVIHKSAKKCNLEGTAQILVAENNDSRVVDCVDLTPQEAHGELSSETWLCDGP